MPPDAHSLAERLRRDYERFSPAQQALARYLSDHLADVPLLSAHEIARASHCSPATVVRFAQSLGYAGYPEMQAVIRRAQRPRLPIRPLAAMKAAAGDNFFYILYFQEPGVAEAELEADPRATMRRFLHTASAEGTWRYVFAAGVFASVAVACFTLAAQDDLAVAGLLIQMGYGVSVLGGVLLFGERSLPTQKLGFAAAIVSVVLISVG